VVFPKLKKIEINMKVIYQFCILLYCLFLFISCEKTRIDENQLWQFQDESKANIKVINAYTSATPAPPTGIASQRFLVFQNGVKMNGIGITAGNFWPTSSGSYASVVAGQSNIRLMNDRLVAGVLGAPVAGDTVANINPNLAAGKYYSMFLVGPTPAQEVIIAEDNLTTIDTGKYRIRLANMTSDPARPIRIFSRRNQKDIFSGVNYKQISDFITLPLLYTGTDTLDLFTVGNATRIASFNSFSPISQFTYTFYTHGKTGLRTEAIGNYTNK
jgi:hypothetical protein